MMAKRSNRWQVSVIRLSADFQYRYATCLFIGMGTYDGYGCV